MFQKNYIFLLTLMVLSAYQLQSTPHFKIHQLPSFLFHGCFLKGRVDRKTQKPATPSIIVLNYTIKPTIFQTLCSLRKHKVSTHFIINTEGEIYQLIDPQDMAFHCGHSSWQPFEQSRTYDVNAHAIGILLINPGHTPTTQTNVEGSELITHEHVQWYPYTSQQIEACTKLCKQLQEQYNISNKDIVGHSEVSIYPTNHEFAGSIGRKVGPGPLFPWKTLADNSVGFHPTISENNAPQSFSISHIQQLLAAWGYHVKTTNDFDRQTQQAVLALQSHFDPTHIDGTISTRVIKILLSLHQQLNEKNT